ncbi:hypothetical protein M5K25_003164 [Dendrobium thyrsiflorum]|uniref:Glucosidase 2 subunit beta n=1 Tax=Dendrobium thyrsiflorum TaxID=117978 RepID=A0ABD0VPC8_DENTH
METRLRFALLLTSFFVVWVYGATPIPNKQLLGIDPQDLSYYKSNVIKCKDGSKKFAKELLNDEFCDCPDGTDEPGTSACPEGNFYCQNAGHTSIKIFSSRVNDGICDCCDGSDEYDSNANCTNTCWEAGKVAREKLKKKIETFKEGLIIRKEEVEKANKAYAKDEADLAKLKSDEKVLKELVQKLREQKERIDKLEEEERLKKEKEEKSLREEEEKSKEQEIKTDETQLFDTMENHEQDGSTGNLDIAVDSGNDNLVESKKASTQTAEQHVGEGHDDTLESSDGISQDGEISSYEEPKQDQDDSGSTEELSREELGRLVASRWTGEGADQTTDKIGNVEEDLMDQDPSVAHEHKGYTSETDDDRAKDDDDDDNFEDDRDDEFEDDHSSSDGSYIADEYEKPDPLDSIEVSNPTWLDKIQQTVQSVLQAFNFFKTPVNVSDATHIRKEYDDTSSKLSKVQSRISSLTEKLKRDLGKEKEFYFFYDQCFESKQNKYVYKICPFKQASQDEGYSSTRLGSWDNFEESYRVMVFTNGEKCWNGPDRSLKVRLRCGLKNEISDVDEPSRCEYTALMSTPALCLEDKLKELEKKLEQMNTRKPQGHHDEL